MGLLPSSRVDWRRLLAAALGLSLAACAGPAPVAPVASTPPQVVKPSAGPPTWRPGDRWVYGWTSGTASGVKVIEVREIREISGVPFYFVRTGEVDVLYTQTLQWAGTVRENRVATRMTPPEPWFMWPLETGRRWNHRGTYEEQGASRQVTDNFAVVGAETIEVPAGRFSTIKIVREGDRRDADEYWYAPDVGFYAKWVGRRGDEGFEEQLREYRPAPRLIPPTAPPAPPSSTK